MIKKSQKDIDEQHVRLRAEAFKAAGNSPKKALELARKEFERNKPKAKNLPMPKKEK